jgi:hypothetical protein
VASGGDVPGDALREVRLNDSIGGLVYVREFEELRFLFVEKVREVVYRVFELWVELWSIVALVKV